MSKGFLRGADGGYLLVNIMERELSRLPSFRRGVDVGYLLVGNRPRSFMPRGYVSFVTVIAVFLFFFNT